MNLPVSPIRKECEKVIALNVDPLVADEYSKNVVSIALRAYHFIFQANTLPQKGIADLLIESYGLEEYSNREPGTTPATPGMAVIRRKFRPDMESLSSPFRVTATGSLNR